MLQPGTVDSRHSRLEVRCRDSKPNLFPLHLFKHFRVHKPAQATAVDSVFTSHQGYGEPQLRWALLCASTAPSAVLLMPDLNVAESVVHLRASSPSKFDGSTGKRQSRPSGHLRKSGMGLCDPSMHLCQITSSVHSPPSRTTSENYSRSVGRTLHGKARASCPSSFPFSCLCPPPAGQPLQRGGYEEQNLLSSNIVPSTTMQHVHVFLATVIAPLDVTSPSP